MTAELLSLVFTGHMLPGRSPPRFPPEIVEAAGIEIERRIARHTEGRSKTSVKGFASLARGGDILFHEICRNFGFDTVIVLPFAPDLFLKTSVEGAEGGNWPQRFQKLWDETPPAGRHVLGLLQSDDPYAICNERVLELAGQEGVVQLIALWNGGGGDGPGGTADLVERAKRHSGQEPEIIDPKIYFGSRRGVVAETEYAILKPKYPGQRRLLALDGGERHCHVNEQMGQRM